MNSCRHASVSEGVSEGRDNSIAPKDKTGLFSRQTQRAKFLLLEELQGQTTQSIKVTILILKIHINSKVPRPAGLSVL